MDVIKEDKASSVRTVMIWAKEQTRTFESHLLDSTWRIGATGARIQLKGNILTVCPALFPSLLKKSCPP